MSWLSLFAIVALAAPPKTPDYGKRFDALYNSSLLQTEKSVAEINTLLRRTSMLGTGAISPQGSVTTPEVLAAAISTSVEGTEAGLAVDVFALDTGAPDPSSLVVSLGALKDGASRVGLAYAYKTVPDVAHGDYCEFTGHGKVSDEEREKLRKSFVAVCEAVAQREARRFKGATTSNRGESQLRHARYMQAVKRLRAARRACGHDEPRPEHVGSDDTSLIWAAAQLKGVTRDVASAGQSGQPGFVHLKGISGFEDAIEAFRKVGQIKPCDAGESARKYKEIVAQRSTTAYGVAGSLDFFQLKRGHGVDDDDDPIKATAVSVEVRHGPPDYQVTFGSTFKGTRADPQEEMEFGLEPQISLECAVWNLSDDRDLPQLKPDDPRLVLGVDLSPELSLDEGDGVDFRSWTARVRLDTTITEKLKVRLAVPLKATLVADESGEEGWQYTLPTTIATVVKF